MKLFAAVMPLFVVGISMVHYHLKKADLIFETRYQKYIYYEINTSVFESVVMWLMQFQEDKDEPQK